jgi:topoisomerase-4 subunit A
MSTKILPHNILEVLEAEKACLEGKPFKLYPDFPTGGLVDVSEYKDGNGRVLVRAKLDASDPKRIVIRELPFGSTTESLINSVETAAKAGRIKIQSINDFTTEKVEIEIRLARGVYAQETIDALFAFTECEQSISVNLLVIDGNLPVVMSVTEVIQRHARQLIDLLTKELELEKTEQQRKLRFRTLERIFIEEGLYKVIEKMKTAEAVEKAVINGFIPYRKAIGSQEVAHDDIEHLLKIPIRRLSLYDISKAKADMKEIQARIKEINGHLKNITAYGIAFLDSIIDTVKANEELGRGVRKTPVGAFEKVAVKEVVKKDIQLKYDSSTGYLGTGVAGEVIAEVSPFDRILAIRNNGTYSVTDISEKTFIGPGAWWIGVADKEAVSALVFTIIYKEAETGYPCVKRCVIEGWIMNKDYSLVPEGSSVLHVDTRREFSFTAYYTPKPRIKIGKETFNAQDFSVRGLKAGGLRVADREIDRIELV